MPVVKEIITKTVEWGYNQYAQAPYPISDPVRVDLGPEGAYVIAVASLGGYGTYQEHQGFVQGYISKVETADHTTFTPGEGNLALFEGARITKLEARLRANNAWGWLVLTVYVCEPPGM